MTKERSGRLFVTGFLRSGTTVLEKALHAHPELSVASQPAPFLHIGAKREFLSWIGRESDQYPLGSLFRENDYSSNDLIEYLNATAFSQRKVHSWLSDLRGYSGWLTPQLDASFRNPPKGRLLELAGWIAEESACVLGKPDVKFKGFKEVFAEELIPYFGVNGWVCIVILRHPVDVWRSIRHGRGAEFVDSSLPLIHVVRQWRKSVGFWIMQSESLISVRFEDLVKRPKEELDAIADRLGVRRSGMVSDLGTLRGQSGAMWKGNSSFAGARPGVDDNEKKLIELLCGPELVLCGYDGDGVDNDLTYSQFLSESEGLLSAEDQELEWSRHEMICGNVSWIDETWFPGDVTVPMLRQATLDKGLR